MRWPHHSCREMHQSLQMVRGRGCQGEEGALAHAQISPPATPPKIEA